MLRSGTGLFPVRCEFGGSITWLICYLLCKRPIGGWLLLYVIALYTSLLANIIFGVMILPYIGPGSRTWFAVFVATAVPVCLFILAEFVLSWYLVLPRRRDWRYIEMLKKLLFVHGAYCLLTLPLDIILFPGKSIPNAIVIVWSGFWFFYFKWSNRVRYVFKDKQWDYEVFHPREAPPSPPPMPVARGAETEGRMLAGDRSGGREQHRPVQPSWALS